MRYLTFVLLLSNFLYAQKLSIGLAFSFSPNVQEYLVNANRDIPTNNIRFLEYGTTFRVQFSRVQTGVILKYGYDIFVDKDIVIRDTEDWDYLEQKANRKIKILNIGIPLFYIINLNNTFQLNLGFCTAVNRISLYDRMSIILAVPDTPAESGDFKDTDTKTDISFEPQVECQIKLFNSVGLYFGLDYSFYNITFNTNKTDEDSRIKVPKTEYKYSFKGLNYYASLNYLF